MIEPNVLQTQAAATPVGLYESYYFRGVSTDGRYGFWLKHNLLRRNGEANITISAAAILFDRQTQDVTKAECQETITPAQFSALDITHHKNLDNLAYAFQDGNRIGIQDNRMAGAIQDGEVTAKWDFALMRSGAPYYHFARNWFYHGFFPKKKLLTRDTHLRFDGSIQVGDQSVEGTFIGINGHNWGKEHAYTYAYADCNLPDDIYFEGVSAKLAFAGGKIKTPYLGGASLHIDGTKYDFNRMRYAPKCKVNELSQKRWIAQFSNNTHRLEIDLNGEDAPWVTLEYPHPDGKMSLCHNTKFAKGVLTLKTIDGQLVAEKKSDFFELETVFPPVGMVG